jgi:hypothetical protein
VKLLLVAPHQRPPTNWWDDDSDNDSIATDLTAATPSLVAPKKRIIIHSDNDSSVTSLTPYANDIDTAINISSSTDDSDQNPTSVHSVPVPDPYSPAVLRTSSPGSFETFNPLHAWRHGSSEIGGDDSDNSTQMHNNDGPSSDVQDSNSNYFPCLDDDDVEDEHD